MLELIQTLCAFTFVLISVFIVLVDILLKIEKGLNGINEALRKEKKDEVQCK